LHRPDCRLDGIDSTIVYVYRVGDVPRSHGHYLVAHLRNSLGNRIPAGSAMGIAGGGREAELMAEDCVAVVVPDPWLTVPQPADESARVTRQ
jgi:hypothetical protein